MFNFAGWGNDLYTGRKSYDIVGRRRLWYAIAAVLVIASALLLLTRGLNPGIEFRGGSEFQVPGVEQPDLSVAEDTVLEVVPDAATPRATVMGGDTVRVQTEQLDDQQTDQVADALAQAYDVDRGTIASSYVGPVWGQDVTDNALRALVIFLVLVGIVIALYFRTWKMAAAALLALAHDLVLTVGLYSLIGFEVTPATVIGFLTILGYSLYDTVVVFDKVRENTQYVLQGSNRNFGEAANLAVNQTLVRSINTSVVAALPVAAILFIGAFLLGAGTLMDISLVLLIGTIVGTYSSVFLATPMLVHMREREPDIQEQAGRVTAKRSSLAREEAARDRERSGEGEVAGEGADTQGQSATAVMQRTRAASATREGGRGPRNQPRRKPRGRRGGSGR